MKQGVEEVKEAVSRVTIGKMTKTLEKELFVRKER